MDRQKKLMRFVYRARRSLNLERMLMILQYGILTALILSMAILIVSRFFVFPYYVQTALMIGFMTIIFTIIWMVLKRVRKKEALIKLDAFYPYNELVTALSFKIEEHPLVESILEKSLKESEEAFARFKKRPKQLWSKKALIGILFTVMAIVLLSVFPAETQQEAKVVEKEREIVKELEKEVAELEKKAKSKEVKKEMKELLEKLKEVETSEEALKEVVKKQKELKLEEQKLKEQMLSENNAEGLEGLTEEQLEQLKELAELHSELAKGANNTQSALGKIGKPVSFALQNAISQEVNSQSENESGTGSSGQGSTGNGSQENGDSNSSNEGQGNGNSNQGQSSGQGQGGSGNGQGQGGQGQSSGSGQGGGGLGSSSGAGGGGSGAGSGAGDRSLLSIPERIGGSSDPTIDGGPLGGGEPIGEQKGPVPVTKGTIRPYEEVIGQYEDSYMESSERLQLPKDLQQIVESYFSQVQSNE